MSWQRQLSIARLIAARTAPYLASALVAMRPVETPGLHTLGVDRWWRLYVDPEACDRWTVEELAGVLLHEVNHLLRDHASRRPDGVDPHLWNIVGDLEINDDLVKAGVQLPSPMLPSMFDLPDGQTAERYLADIEQSVESPTCDCGSGAHGIARDHEEDAAGGLSAARAEAVRQRTAHAIRAAGNAPSGLRDWADHVLDPVVPWPRLLAAIAARRGARASVSRTDHSFARPARRTRPGGPILPRLEGRRPSVALVVDTSGSISAAELAAAIGEVIAAVRAAGPLTLVWCDTAVTVQTRVTRIRPAEIPGGGGTDLRVGIDAAADMQPDLLVVLTDGHTPWPGHPPTAQTVIVVSDPDCPPPPDWATVLHT